jgi:hypothetical protein
VAELSRHHALDFSTPRTENCGMVIPGHVSNGVVVLEGEAALPEGAAVAVVYLAQPPRTQGASRTRVSFPLVRSKQPGSVDLNNDRIAEILDGEDAAPRY